MEESIAKVKEALKGDDAEAITKATEELSTTVQAVGSELYSKAETDKDSNEPSKPAEPSLDQDSPDDQPNNPDDESK